MITRHDDSSSRSMLHVPPESATLWLVLGKASRLVSDSNDTLPNDIDALRAMILAERAAHAAVAAERDTMAVERDRLAARNTTLEATNATLEAAKARLEEIIAEIRRAHFGRKSEKITDDQLALALEELEAAAAKIESQAQKAEEKADPERKAPKKPRSSRAADLAHLPREEIVIEPACGTVCPCCQGQLHRIGEDRAERLDKVPAKVRVLIEVRPKYACRNCEKNGADVVAGIIQAPAPNHLIEGGLPTEALIADVLVSKHADHVPLYRQSQIFARQHGVRIERSTMSQWVGRGAAELQPLHDYLLADLKASPKLFCDETRCPVLDPGNGETKTGYMWALARDDRPWGGTAPPAVAYTYAPGRGGKHAVKLLAGFTGILQVDGYSAYHQLARPTRAGGPLTLVFCWSHFRRLFYEVFVGGNAPIATEALARIQKLYEIEADIRGSSPEVRHAARQTRSKPLVEALKPWLQASLGRVSQSGKIAKAIRYGLNHWNGLCRFLDDGRIEIDSNTVERSIRGLALTRKNALFAGHDEGAAGWAMIASLIETCLCRARHKAVYADRRTMPNGLGRALGWCTATVGAMDGGISPFGIVRLLTAPPGMRAGGPSAGTVFASHAHKA